MKTALFRQWLRDCYVQANGKALAAGTQVSRIANCSTIERFEGDLDAHFQRDGMADLLERLSYSVADQTKGMQPKHRIPINGDISNGSTTHRSAVNLYRKFCVSLENRFEAADIPISQDDLTSTERRILTTARIGQQRYRYLVLERWDYRCAITKASILLTASHIKPWRACSDEERLDPSNGICLSPLFDRAFDSGIITFDFDGSIHISPQVPSCEIRRLGLAADRQLVGLRHTARPYLSYHHAHVWRCSADARAALG